MLDHRESKKFQKNIHFCFIDYTKAFDWVNHNKLWRTLEEVGIPDPLTCLLRNLHAGQEATVRTLYGTTDWFRTEKGVPQSCIFSPCSFHLYAEHACMLTHFSHVQLFETLWTVACQASLSMGFSWQEYWSGLPCPPPGDLPDPGIEPLSPESPALQVDYLHTEPPGKPYMQST